jgi:hypothetical protein
MKHIKHLPQAIALASLLATAPAWSQPPSVAYSFGSASGSGSTLASEPAPSRAPGADALRWLGGLGSTQSEPSPAAIAAAERAAVSHRH